ncbi:methyltransferase domain-containing protein [Spirosoma linguale]|uniref:3-demethylubiquinone-9 3-O-methyltransferase n=1 Tax=Spirosoma linguale (strain ATCC 33905 / DSM 74 / LMG 10896 / Claus 1) TaxID=504472 RepID=D2QGP4_SPILD|nr:3-demethylubiquinone-9 3-O-methyltransferase [Spirosoma linguale DSM 74]
MNLQTRSTRKELLDDDTIPFADISRNMQELDRVNHWLGGHSTTLKGFKTLLGDRKQVHVCEIGSGGGDNLLVLLTWCKQHSIDVHLTGIDFNPHCIAFARTRTLLGQNRLGPNGLDPATTWITSDYRDVNFDTPPDIIFSSLFCHHFTDDELVDQLGWMHRTARIGFFINDLHRHPFAYYAIKWLTRLFSRSYLVKHDAPLSVARGFRKKEWQQLFTKANLDGYTIRHRWAFRHLITCKPE